MKQYLILLVALLMFSPLSSYAEKSWYGGVGAGFMVVHGINPSPTEKEIVNTAGVVSNSSIENKSTYKSFAIGHCFEDSHFCAEGAYLWGGEFNTETTVNNYNPETLNLLGTQVNFTNQPVNLTVRREAIVSATQASLIGKLPVNEFLGVFGRVGIYNYRIHTTIKILLPQNLYLAEESEDVGTIPMVSIGADIKPTKRLSLRFEGQKTGRVTIGSVSIIWQF